MKELTVRPYKTGDERYLDAVCLATTEMKVDTEAKKESLYLRYIRYYYEQEKESVFTVCDGEKPVGYIVCAPNHKKFQKTFFRDYLGKVRCLTPFGAFVFWGETLFRRFFIKRYPAHLHIDILPEYQRGGNGTALMDRLFEYLKEKNICGVHLITGAKNVKGNSFYKKYGFTVLFRLFGAVVYGKKITE